tara:strand:- start:145 stop:1137 length:993 start_codon:yes stop_codon:yes gene_type:complete
MNFKIGIIGFGLIGQKRAKNLGKGTLIAYSDINKPSEKNSVIDNAIFYNDWNDLINVKEIDIVIVATPNNLCFEIMKKCIKHKKHILVEKPAAKNSNEILELIELSYANNVKVHVGFNHRYHPAIIGAKKIIDEGKLGELMFIRARYGHGGRIGYEKEWRANPEISGGGEIIDQGSHLIDLSRWFFQNEFSKCLSSAKTYFWDMKVEDNGFMILETPSQQTAFLHVSCTEWKNLFSMEIYGKNGKIKIDGLGGSYGVETLTYYKMLPEMGPPKIQEWIYDQEDMSWQVEINEFYNEIIENKRPSVGLNDAMETLKIVEKIYTDNNYDYST